MSKKVSIITISYNCKQELAHTIPSVMQQTYADIEFIVVDGGSNDGTLDVIQHYEHTINHWVSEEDNGIYHAMNKGVKMATGDWVIFMNAGDWFHSETAVEQCMELLEDGTDLLYGNHEVIYEDIVKFKEAGVIDDIWKGMVFSHQSLFCKRQLLLDCPFDEEERIVADFMFIFLQWHKKKVFQKVPILISCFQAGGVSDLNNIKGKQTARKFVKQYIDDPKVDKHYKAVIRKLNRIHILKKYTPRMFFTLLMKGKNKLTGEKVYNKSDSNLA